MNSDLKKITIDIKDIGTFVLRYPNIKDTIEVARIRAERYFYGVKFDFDEETGLSSPLGIDAMTYGLATTVCELVAVCEKKPDDFEFDECDDLEIISELYEKYEAWRLSFRGSTTSREPPEGTAEGTA